jgi:hypothetical protein
MKKRQLPKKLKLTKESLRCVTGGIAMPTEVCPPYLHTYSCTDCTAWCRPF